MLLPWESFLEFDREQETRALHWKASSPAVCLAVGISLEGWPLELFWSGVDVHTLSTLPSTPTTLFRPHEEGRGERNGIVEAGAFPHSAPRTSIVTRCPRDGDSRNTDAALRCLAVYSHEQTFGVEF